VSEIQQPTKKYKKKIKNKYAKENRGEKGEKFKDAEGKSSHKAAEKSFSIIVKSVKKIGPRERASETANRVQARRRAIIFHKQKSLAGKRANGIRRTTADGEIKFN